MKLTDKALFFQSDEGHVVVYGDAWGRTLLYSSDGLMFYELEQRGFGGNSDEHDISFEDAHSGKQGRWHRSGDTLELDGKTYKKVESRSEVEVVPLPTVRKPEYLLRLPDGRYIYVSADKYRYSYESFKLFIGNPENMQEVPVTHVERFRDGGTTNVATAEGTLHCPAHHRGYPATWNGTELTELEPSQFQITETEAGVRISKDG